MVVHTSESAPIFVDFVTNAPDWPEGCGQIGYERGERKRRRRREVRVER